MKVVRVLIVDDSGFIRRRVADLFADQDDIQVVGEASNGLEAIHKVSELEPDVVTMDIEMPVMDGITAVKQIMRDKPTPVLMFSVATHHGTQATINALEAGAMDFLPKRLDEIDADAQNAKRLLCSRIRGLGWQAKQLRETYSIKQRSDSDSRLALRAATRAAEFTKNRYSLLAIAASTGGPIAIQKILSTLPDGFPLPVLLIQHMPANFTSSFAQRLDNLCKIRVKEAEDGDRLEPGLALLAPGGLQMELSRGDGLGRVSIRESHPDELFRPCVDVAFASIAQNLSKNVLAVVLTGMGADGKVGAQKLRACGASIWAQDESSCTVYGMPKAIIDANLADRVLNIDALADRLASL